MAKLVDCATIFQLAFGVNAILPTIILAYRRTQDNIVQWVSKTIDKHKPEFAIEPSEMGEFLDFVTGLNPGLSALGLGKRIPIVASGISLFASFFGMIFAATTPDRHLGNGILWLFAVYSLVVCPSLVAFYTFLLRFDEQELVKLWARDRRALVNTAAAFREMRDREKARFPDVASEKRWLEAEIERRKAELPDTLLSRLLRKRLR